MHKPSKCLQSDSFLPNSPRRLHHPRHALSACFFFMKKSKKNPLWAFSLSEVSFSVAFCVHTHTHTGSLSLLLSQTHTFLCVSPLSFCFFIFAFPLTVTAYSITKRGNWKTGRKKRKKKSNICQNIARFLHRSCQSAGEH